MRFTVNKINPRNHLVDERWDAYALDFDGTKEEFLKVVQDKTTDVHRTLVRNFAQDGVGKVHISNLGTIDLLAPAPKYEG